MVSNAAQLLIDEAIERGSNLHDLPDYAYVQINDTHPSMVIPELIRLLTEKHGFEFDEAVAIVSKMVGYTNHTILAEALEKWPLDYLEEVVPHLVVSSRNWMLSFVKNTKIHVFKSLTNTTVFTWHTWISTSLQALTV